VADDHEIVRKGLRSLLEAQPGGKSPAKQSDGREAVEKAREFSPRIILSIDASPRGRQRRHSNVKDGESGRNSLAFSTASRPSLASAGDLPTRLKLPEGNVNLCARFRGHPPLVAEELPSIPPKGAEEMCMILILGQMRIVNTHPEFPLRTVHKSGHLRF